MPIEDLSNELGLSDLQEKAVFDPVIDLGGVAEAHLLFAEAGGAAWRRPR